jgi:hypothetical protein
MNGIAYSHLASGTVVGNSEEGSRRPKFLRLARSSDRKTLRSLYVGVWRRLMT